jgi:hypothetical protein
MARGGLDTSWTATKSAARPCQAGELLSVVICAASWRTVAASQRELLAVAARDASFPLSRWEVARAGMELIPLAPAAPTKSETATKVNAMSAIRGCLRILLLLGVSETPVGSRWMH